MANKHPADHTRYEVITQEDSNGDMIIPIPIPVLKKLGWKEGDSVEIGIDGAGKLFLKKASKGLYLERLLSNSWCRKDSNS